MIRFAIGWVGGISAMTFWSITKIILHWNGFIGLIGGFIICVVFAIWAYKTKEEKL
jgi:hypothetical protein